MRRASKILALAIIGVSCLFGLQSTAQAAGGLTITPATLTLNILPGSNEQTAELNIVNHYDAAVLVRFTFEPRLDDAAADQTIIRQLSISQPEATIAAGATIKQIITVHDDDKLSPGSQLADLVITQVAAANGNIGVQPSVRLPLVIIKEAGAIAGFNISKVSVPKFSLSMPHSLGVTVRNTGNVIAIPHGLVTISGPNGTVQQGVLNTSSLAVSPKQDLALATPLTKLEGMQLPGFYRATISYGLGGDQAKTTTSTLFFYIAWWHIAALVLAAFGAYHLIRYLRRPRSNRSRMHHPPARTLLMRKGAA